MKLGFLIASLFATVAFSQDNYVSETSGNLTIEYDAALQKIMTEKENAICVVPEEEKEVKKPEFCNGVRVQVFYGKSRQEAEAKLKEVKTLFPNLHANVVYHSPDYKVHLGYFESRNDAAATLNRAKRNFPASFIYNETFRCSLIGN
ncbi:MAG: SPOR domain-containing protein [Moheibacter sp.]